MEKIMENPNNNKADVLNTNEDWNNTLHWVGTFGRFV